MIPTACYVTKLGIFIYFGSGGIMIFPDASSFTCTFYIRLDVPQFSLNKTSLILGPFLMLVLYKIHSL